MAEVEEILADVGELCCVIRFSHAAGNRSYEFFEDFEPFARRIRQLPPLTSVIVFRNRQFPIRGVVDEGFVTDATGSIDPEIAWTLVRTSSITMGSQSWFHHLDGSSLTELEEELRSTFCWGQPVALGPEPDWHDLEATFEAIVPGLTGVVQRGVY
jgi:hypothetical protein